ncbi:hypothetical protein GAMM_130007 [Gammaproteobacteria bacterium]
MTAKNIDVRTASFEELKGMNSIEFGSLAKRELTEEERKAILRRLSVEELETLGSYKLNALLINMGSADEAPEYQKAESILTKRFKATPASIRARYYRNRNARGITESFGVFAGAYPGDMERVKLMDKAMDYLVLRQFSREFLEQKMLEDKSKKYELMVESGVKWNEIKYEYEGGGVLWKKYDEVNYYTYLKMWDDIDVMLDWVRKYVRALPKETAEQFRRYLEEDTNDYSNKKELMKEITEIFIFLEEIKLFEAIKKEMVKPPITEGKGQLANDIAYSVPGIGYSEIEPQRFLLSPYYPQQGTMTGVAFKAYQHIDLPEGVQNIFRDFLMRNYWDIFVRLTPFSTAGSKKLENDIAAGDMKAKNFEEAMLGLLDANNGKILVTKGGFGEARYLVTKDSLSMLYSDELGLKEVYIKYSRFYPEIKIAFHQNYRWTKNLDDQIKFDDEVIKRREKAIRQYRYYESEQEDDIPIRSMLKKRLLPEEKELLEAFKKEESNGIS